jgi:hypothetical protein
MNQVASRTLAYELLPHHGCVVLYQGTQAPNDAEWDAHIGEVCVFAEAKAEFTVLVYTEGGRPSREQQARLTAAAPIFRTPVAVVSPVLAVRFVVSALSLGKRNLRFFMPEELPAALQYLALAPVGQLAVGQAIERLRQSMHAVDAAG